MLKAPYLLVGFSMPPDTPNCDAIMKELEDSLPCPQPPPFSFGVPDVYAIKTTTATMFKQLDDTTDFFVDANASHGGVIRWFAQLCTTGDIASG